MTTNATSSRTVARLHPGWNRALVGLYALVAVSACAGEGEIGEAAYESELSAEEEAAAEWCFWEWRYGGRAINSAEKQAVMRFLTEVPICGEAKSGLTAALDDILVVAAECEGAKGSYSPWTGRIRITERDLANGVANGIARASGETLLHEWGHKLSSVYDLLVSAEETANTYRRMCLQDPNWTMARQQDGDTGGGGGAQDPPRVADDEPEPYCGDGFVDPGEECDDGNQSSFDGCSGGCSNEQVCHDEGLSGYMCSTLCAYEVHDSDSNGDGCNDWSQCNSMYGYPDLEPYSLDYCWGACFYGLCYQS